MLKCELCGLYYYCLGSHLKWAHNTDIYEYRKLYPDALAIDSIRDGTAIVVLGRLMSSVGVRGDRKGV